MTTDDAPRPALDAAALAEGRRLLSAVTPGAWIVDQYFSDYGLPAGWRIDREAQQYTAMNWVADTGVLPHGEGDARLIAWARNNLDALLAAAARADALAGEVARLRRAVALALDGPSDGEIGMETTLGRLHRIERQLRAALSRHEGNGDGR